MTIEIDPGVRLHALRDATDRLLQALASAGISARLRGAFALAAEHDLEPAPDVPCVVELAAEADPDAQAVRQVMAAWSLPHPIELISADREWTSGCASLDDVEGFDATTELRPPRGDWASRLRGNAGRILEIAAFAAATGQRPSAETQRAMARESGHVLALPRSIWLRWMDRILCSPRASVGLQLLQDTRVLPLLVPEVVAMIDFHRSCPVHHKDIWDHTLQVVDKCPPLPTVRWSALMHDVGKVWTRTVSGRGKVHFFRHEELGAILMEGVAARFEMPAERRDAICYVIGNHARANVYSTEWTDSAVRRLIRDMGDHLDAVLAFSRSDFTTKRAWRVREVRELGEELIRRMDDIRAADARVPPLPKGFGNLVLERTGKQPGRWLGDIQRRLEAEVDAGNLAAGLDAESYLAWVEARAPELLA